MKNVEAFKKYYANATKEQVIEDMYLDNCNLQQELQRNDNIINELEEKVKTLEIENKVLKEQILAMVHPVYTYGIR